MDTEYYREQFEKLLQHSGKKFMIRESDATFKISQYIRKGTESFSLARFLTTTGRPGQDYWTITISYYSMLYFAKAAILSRGYETDDHFATQIALGYLMVPGSLEQSDLELLEQSHKIFHEEYVDYFEDARKESSISRYNVSKRYREKRVSEILKNAERFIVKVNEILE